MSQIGPDKVQIRSTSGLVINPATEDTLNSISSQLKDCSVKIVNIGYIKYIGKAPPGSLTSQPVWKISKLDSSNGVNLQWANGNNESDKIFDNYLSYTYT